MKLRITAPLLLVPMFLIVLNPLSALAGTIPPIIVETLDYRGEGETPTLVFTVQNHPDNVEVVEVVDAPPIVIPYALVAFGVETFVDFFGNSEPPPLGLAAFFPPNGDSESTFPPPPPWGTTDTPAGLTWRSTILTEAMWNGDDLSNPNVIAGEGYAFGVVQESDGTPVPDPDAEDKPYRTRRDMGSYFDNFGQDGIMAAQVAFYFDNEGVQRAIMPGEVQTEFTWQYPYAVPGSSTTGAFTLGNVLGGTLIPTPGATGGSIIPLPSAAWMGLGLMGILAAVRRRRRAR